VTEAKDAAFIDGRCQMARTLSIVAIVVVILMLICSGCGVLKLGGAPKFVLRVNCAATEPYIDLAGNEWLPDQYLSEGESWGAVDGMIVNRGEPGITGTDSPDVYKTERYSMTAYKFKLPDGKYKVRLHFAETYEGITGPGMRVFSVSINGQTVIGDFDPYTDGGGLNKPIVREFKDVEVVGGQLTIGFVSEVQNAEINGIEIISR
jgi:hypothetical protein